MSREDAEIEVSIGQGHSYTVFRVRIVDLQPKTTYYYKVDSANPSGSSDGVISPVKQFTTK